MNTKGLNEAVSELCECVWTRRDKEAALCLFENTRYRCLMMILNVFTLYTQRVGGPNTHKHSITLTESISSEEKRKIQEKSGIYRRRESKAEGR